MKRKHDALNTAIASNFINIVLILIFKTIVNAISGNGNYNVFFGVVQIVLIAVFWLGFNYMANIMRTTRSSMLEAIRQDYIRTARAKGLPERVVIVRHAMRNALMPLASVLPIDFVTMIGGAVITETIFNWAGMGRMFVTSLEGSEIDPVMVYIMITGALAMIANLVADFLYGILDPRIRVNA